MEDFLNIIQNYGPYIGLPVIIAFLTQNLKKNIPFFATVLGLRLVHFLPLIFGLLGGLLLPEETWQAKLLVGGCLGALSIFIYKFITVTIAPKALLDDKIAWKDNKKVSIPPVEPTEDKP
jgi:hypothetical protein